ncbi:MAG: ROK family transcriptional regulator [Paracoccaceae bacterium]|nr:ROK family transcriptional regulator [Paracoccaceae bacterium]
MRAWNERLVLSLVRARGALAKADLARATGLSAQTVSVIMRGLEQDGLLRKGAPVRGKVGQPSVPMSLVPDGAFFFGLKIGRRSSELVLTDFLGTIIGRRTMMHHWPIPAQITRFAHTSIDALRASVGPKRCARVAGMGIAIPFQLWDWAPMIGAPEADMAEWRGYDIRAELAALYDFPVFLENDASAACGAELVFGTTSAPRDFVYFYIGFFIGGGIVLNSSLYTGRTGNAGALGSMPIPARNGETAQLIDLASIAVLERMLHAQGQSSEPIWAQPEFWTIDADILTAWIDSTGDALARAVAACISVIDFEAVLIDGWLPDAVRARIVAATRRQLARLNLSGLEMPELHEGSFGAHARALGAASLPLSERFLVDRNALLKAL